MTGVGSGGARMTAAPAINPFVPCMHIQICTLMHPEPHPWLQRASRKGGARVRGCAIRLALKAAARRCAPIPFCWESLTYFPIRGVDPPTNFLKLHLVRGLHPKLVRGLSAFHLPTLAGPRSEGRDSRLFFHFEGRLSTLQMKKRESEGRELGSGVRLEIV